MSAVAPKFTIVEPESGRYAADLLLVHGLWAGPSVWSRVAAGLAHRGWRCVLLDCRVPIDPSDQRVDLAGWRARAEAAAAELGAPPIVIGHDAGGMVALAMASAGSVRAAISVAPLLGGVGAVVPWSRRALARVVGVAVPPPPASHPAFTDLAGEERAALLGALGPEAGGLVASLRGEELRPGAAPVPRLLVAQSADEVAPPGLLEITANGIEAEYRLLPGGHWPMASARRAEAWLGHLHRWIILRGGEDLLLLRGDEDLREDG